MHSATHPLRVVAWEHDGDFSPTLVARLQRASTRREIVFAEGTADDRLRNIVTGAFRAEVAIIRVDACQGVLPADRRHGYLASILGVPNVAVVMDRMDEVGFSAAVFASLEDACKRAFADLGLRSITCIPASAAEGDNVVERSARMPWYGGASLLGHLEGIASPIEAGPAQAATPAESSSQFEATVVWTGEAPMIPGRSYRVKAGARTVDATIAPLKYRVDPTHLEHLAATKLERGEIGVCQLELDQAIAFDRYDRDPALGGFVVLDRLGGQMLGAGMLRFGLRRAQNIHWQGIDLTKAARARQKGQAPLVLWFTGISASGKSTIANLVEKKLHAMGRHTYLLDGDNVRHGLNKDLGFTEAGRVENIRRVAEVAALMADAGLVVLTAFISPFRSERRMARALLPPGEFVEVFVDTPIEVAEARDPKGLYRKARRGEIRNFTGIDSPYERPERAEIVIDGSAGTAEEAAQRVVEALRGRGL
jgi:bifunctional enzyme CysN/CysC